MRRALVATALALVATAAISAPPTLKPGEWEITMTMDMPGMPMKMPPRTMRQCIKQEDVSRPEKMIPDDKTCKVDEVRQSASGVSWKSTCKTESGVMVGKGEISVSELAYKGSMSMEGKMEGQPFSMKTAYSGKRLGDCK